jgi:hypothetical protein
VSGIINTWRGTERDRMKLMSRRENLAALADLPGRWIDKVHQRLLPKIIVLDMDSSERGAP